MDHYTLFGVTRNVSPAELRRAYRRLAARHHPDRNRDDPAAATRRMAEINEAFSTLSDPVRKFDYDRNLDRPGGSQPPRTGADSRRERPTSTPPPTPADDPLRRARREAKERAAAEAKARRYRDPGGGFFEGSRYH